jgi:hypothetical protein
MKAKLEDYEKFPLLGELTINKLKTDENFLIEFIKFAPGIESDIRSSAVNDDCSCKDVVKAYVESNKTEYVKFLLDYAERFNTEFDLNVSNYVNSYIGGKVAKTTINGWKDFCHKLYEMKSDFKGFSVVKENDDVYVFFI